MKTRYAYIIIALSAIIMFLSGFTSENTFPAPVKEPAAAIYINLYSSGIFDEENNTACEEIAKNVANICKLRNSSDSEKDYRNITLSFLKECIVSGFLKIHEIYFYYKTPKEYALIAKGEFDLSTIAEKSKAEKIYDDNECLFIWFKKKQRESCFFGYCFGSESYEIILNMVKVPYDGALDRCFPYF